MGSPSPSQQQQAEQGGQLLYRYAPLPNAKTHIRLIVFAKEGEDVLFNLSLSTYPIDIAPPFHALSYAWGTQPFTECLDVGEQGSILISAHLLRGLQAVGQTLAPTRIWVDAICINQDDFDEKADQIPLMTQIFSQAERVDVWLGGAADDSDSVMDKMVEISAILNRCDGAIVETNENFRAMGLPPLASPIWEAIGRFWDRAWFKRLWVMQEVILAPRISFVCGDRTVRSKHMFRFAYGLRKTGLSQRVDFFTGSSQQGGHENIEHHFINREEFQNGTLSILRLLQKGRTMDVREPLDRVLGLVGMMDEESRRHIRVDYSESRRAKYWLLYLEVAHMLLERMGLDMLQAAESETRPDGLPSWVPNWNSCQIMAPLSGHFKTGLLDQSGSPGGSSDYAIDSQKLRARGIYIGTIVEKTRLRQRNHHRFEEFWGPAGVAAQELAVVLEALEMCKRHVSGPEDQVLARFARTLVNDTSRAGSSVLTTSYTGPVLEDFQWYRRYLTHSAYGRTGEGALWRRECLTTHVARFGAYLRTTGRCVFVTSDGRMGVASESCNPGDVVSVLLGAKHPYILRPADDGRTHRLVSSAYAEGVMFGECLNAARLEAAVDYIIT